MTTWRDRWLFGHWCENQRRRIEYQLEQFGRQVKPRDEDEAAVKPTADEQANRLRRVSYPYSRDEDVKP